jgi:integrase
MASVHKPKNFKTTFWWAAFTGADGKRYFRSTKQTNKSKALEIAHTWERLARGNPNEAHFRKVAANIYENVAGKPLHFYSCGDWLSTWLKTTKGSVADGTYEKYRGIIDDFRRFLEKADAGPLAAISPSEITAYRDELRRRGLVATTINVNVCRAISSAFESARKLGYITVNPCSGVKPLKDDVFGPKRDYFRAEQVDALLEAAKDTEWEGMILCGHSTGLRVGDAASLEWGQIDLPQKVLRVTAQKTGTLEAKPIHENFLAWLENQTPGIGKAPVFPGLYHKKSGGCSGLSATFRKIMEKAGVVGETVRKGVGNREDIKGNKARTGRRTSSLSFHSLRHASSTEMAIAGVEPHLRKMVTGQKDDRVHERYTHFPMEKMREAVGKIPVPKPKGKKKSR